MVLPGHSLRLHTSDAGADILKRNLPDSYRYFNKIAGKIDVTQVNIRRLPPVASKEKQAATAPGTSISSPGALLTVCGVGLGNSLARVMRMMIIKILHSSDERFVITFNID
ncbi:hypothetical protein [Escherichia coli]|uniref:hypothetical protein n=1 Tax=Escherichia coli TaxID=562 RepID=UPI0001E8A73B|nr:hypothetical protein [Escherichia coli]